MNLAICPRGFGMDSTEIWINNCDESSLLLFLFPLNTIQFIKIKLILFQQIVLKTCKKQLQIFQLALSWYTVKALQSAKEDFGIDLQEVESITFGINISLVHRNSILYESYYKTEIYNMLMKVSSQNITWQIIFLNR